METCALQRSSGFGNCQNPFFLFNG